MIGGSPGIGALRQAAIRQLVEHALVWEVLRTKEDLPGEWWSERGFGGG